MRNIIHPRYIISPNDGDRHFICYAQLVRLYKLDPKTCRLYDPLHRPYLETDRHYYPDASGDRYAK